MKEKRSLTIFVICSRVPVSLSIRSHLLIAITQPLPALWAIPATRVSCSVMPTEASISITHTSERSTAARARTIEYFSTLSSILPFLRIPAVSMMVNLPYLFSTKESIVSRVVPAISDTILLSSPIILLESEDLPALGRPIRATRIVSLPSSSSASSGKNSKTASRSSPIPSL